MSLRDQIREMVDRRPKKIDVPEWPDVNVYIGLFNGIARETFERTFFDMANTTDPQKIQNGEVEIDLSKVDLKFRAKIAAAGLCEADGTAVYDPFNEADVNELSQKNFNAINFIYDQVMEYNGMTDSDGAKAEKN